MKECGGARDATNDNIMQCMHFASWISKAAHARAHTHTHTEICNSH